MFGIRLEFDAVTGPLDRLGDAVDDGLLRAADRCAEIVADEAIRNHSFTNRTSYLEGSITALPSTGSFQNETLTAFVVAQMPYGSFLEESPGGKWAFLLPALEAVEREIEAETDRQMNSAAARAGWDGTR